MIDLLRKGYKTALRRIDFPNPKLNIGLFEDNMSSVPSPEILVQKNRDIDFAKELEEDKEHMSGKGKLYIPETKDFYMGEAV